MNRDEISAKQDTERRIRALGEWFHNMELGGVSTAPEHFLGDYPGWIWRRLQPALPSDLSGRTVLDVGCNGGFFSIEMKRLGAERVVGIDPDERYLAQARFAAEILDVEIELHRMSVYEIEALKERFDVVLFMGVLYHLRHPLLALDLLHEHATKDLFICQSLQRGSRDVAPLAPDHPFAEEEVFNDPAYPRLHFVEQSFAGDPTNWWIPNRACCEAMLRSAGYKVVRKPSDELYLCLHKQ
ncbi:TIGR04290 family methyltransferase [Aquibaculum sediminis]|uniref:TIGR04290 family methyltransferase n=1 Tax=Aquibaculum sediminis TaxID=3231907 RepID=UPI003455570D